MKHWKLMVGILILLPILFVASGALLVASIDSKRVVAELSQYIKSEKNRTLTINGPVRLEWFPSIGVELSDLSLSEPGSKTRFVSLGSLKASVQVWPLFKRRVVLDDIRVANGDITLVKHSDGSFNFSDLLLPSQSTSTPIGFNVHSLDISHATVRYTDQRSGQQYMLDKASLNVGQVAQGVDIPILLSARFVQSKPLLESTITLASQLNFDMTPALRIHMKDTSLRVLGSLENMPLDVSLNSQLIQIDPDRLQSALVHGSTQFKNKQQTWFVDVSSPVLALFANRQVQLSGLTTQITGKGDGIPGADYKLLLTGALDMHLAESAADLTLKSKDSPLGLTLSAGFRMAHRPLCLLEVNAAQLDLDPWVGSTSTGAGESIQTDAGNNSTAPFKFEWMLLSLADLKINATIRQMIYQGARYNDVQAVINDTDGFVQVAPLSLKAFGGQINGQLSLDSKTRTLSVKQDITQLDVSAALKQFLHKDPVSGKANLQVNLSTQGSTIREWKAGLQGTGAVRIVDGSINGINIAQSLRDIKAKLGNASNETSLPHTTQKTDFTELAASFVIKDGIATSNDLSGKSPLLRMGGQGSADLAHSTLDYVLKATVVNTATGQGGKELQDLKDLTIPVRFTGPFDQLRYDIQWAQMSSEAIKNAFKDKVAPRLEEKKQDLKDSLKEKIDESLNRFLKRQGN